MDFFLVGFGVGFGLCYYHDLDVVDTIYPFGRCCYLKGLGIDKDVTLQQILPWVVILGVDRCRHLNIIINLFFIPAIIVTFVVKVLIFIVSYERMINKQGRVYYSFYVTGIFFLTKFNNNN